MPNPFLHRQMQHDVWGTEQLVALCRKLTPAQLELTTAGTYGTIIKTLQHIVVADENYLIRLSGRVLHDPVFRLTDAASLDGVAMHLTHVKDAVERLFAGPTLDPERLITDTPSRPAGAARFEMRTWVPASQFVNHGVDHRSHINTILAVNGLETIDLQVWPYATALGASYEATP